MPFFIISFDIHIKSDLIWGYPKHPAEVSHSQKMKNRSTIVTKLDKIDQYNIDSQVPLDFKRKVLTVQANTVESCTLTYITGSGVCSNLAWACTSTKYQVPF